jgi:N-acetylglucosaminyldiphosphoundecaprenol N-acetyl-beta-D-mannosaminyltransferase
MTVDACTPEDALGAIVGWVRRGEKGYVAFANVHGVMEGKRDRVTRAAFNGARLVGADGMPLVWLAWLRGREGAARVYGPDMTLLVCEAAAREGWGCYFYGGAEGVAAALAAVLRRRFPGLQVAGVHSPPFRSLDAAEDDAEVARLNASGAKVVFVGLGCPKQERWMADHAGRLEARILLGVGAAFDFHAGRVRQAPRWMMKLGLEWLFRLWQEPRRLALRYLVHNPAFVFHVLLEGLGLRRYPVDPPGA